MHKIKTWYFCNGTYKASARILPKEMELVMMLIRSSFPRAAKYHVYVLQLVTINM